MILPSRRTRIAAAMVAAVGLIGVAATSAPAQSDREWNWDPDWEREDIPERLEDIPGQVERALRGLIDTMKPALEDAFDMVAVLERIDSPANYEKPVILPNGDILIRRSADAPEWDPDYRERDDRERRPGPPHRRLDIDPNEGARI